MRFVLLSGILFGATSIAAKIYAASYSGTVTTLSPRGGTGLMTCQSSLRRKLAGVNSNGSLTMLDVLDTLPGPVMSAIYLQGFSLLSHTNNEASAVTAYTFDSASAHLNKTQEFTYQIPAAGPVPDRQDVSHPHGAIVDPTGRFVVVPDLGMDKIHIFKICPSSSLLLPQTPLVVNPGSGPRHAVFWIPKTRVGSVDNTFLYLVSELDNTFSAFKSHYTHNSLTFAKVHKENTYGGNAAPSGSKVSGIQISPGNERIMVSNRGDATFGEGSDTFAVFTCFTANGNGDMNVSSVGLFPAYGSFPREFDFNENNGTIVVALQNSHEVAVIQWNEQTRSPGKLISKKSLDGEIPAAIWGP
ncbi:uncharacterized protein N7479_001195 [Penicillium vulpinum]|uniref:uncharacterized protein n=1 Tax=Penicillium vulpinum TaxID=29845 RepID=UPI0025490102|nr:uncharacterized protein N7479_001195 [Penicillium vulpinum]KAJ5971277.1 hypothetical protein N7479_001195 [Penicillium vulpinum]